MSDIPTNLSLKDFNIQPEYSPFHPELDNKFPIDKMILADNLNDVSEGKIPNLNWISFFRNSPASNSEAEILMGQFVVAAARAGQWVDIPHREDESSEVKTDSPFGQIDFGTVKLEFTRAGKLLVDKDLAKSVTDDDGKEWFAPTEKLLEFISERMKPFAPKT